MEFSDIQEVVESVLEAPIAHVEEVDAGNINDVFKIVLQPPSPDSPRDELFVKAAPDIEQERQGSETLSELGINVPVVRAFIKDSGAGTSLMITEMVRGISLAELCKEDPHKAIEFFADSFVLFHSTVKKEGIVHGDFCLPNVIVRNPFSTPDFVFLDTSEVREASIWVDVCAAAFTVDFNTRELPPQFSSVSFLESFSRRLHEGNRRLLLSGGEPIFSSEEIAYLQTPGAWKTLNELYFSDDIEADLAKTLPFLGRSL